MALDALTGCCEITALHFVRQWFGRSGPLGRPLLRSASGIMIVICGIHLALFSKG
jgi:hypothetical protein